MNESTALRAESGTVQCTANFLYTALMMCATVTHAPVFISKVSRNVLRTSCTEHLAKCSSFSDRLHKHLCGQISSLLSRSIFSVTLLFSFVRVKIVLDVVWKRGQHLARGCRVAAPRCILTLRAAARGSGLLTGQRAPLARLSCVTARAETTPRRVQRVHGSHRKVANIFSVHVNIWRQHPLFYPCIMAVWHWTWHIAVNVDIWHLAAKEHCDCCYYCVFKLIMSYACK